MIKSVSVTGKYFEMWLCLRYLGMLKIWHGHYTDYKYSKTVMFIYHVCTQELSIKECLYGFIDVKFIEMYPHSHTAFEHLGNISDCNHFHTIYKHHYVVSPAEGPEH